MIGTVIAMARSGGGELPLLLHRLTAGKGLVSGPRSAGEPAWEKDGGRGEGWSLPWS